jgi:hypothetical protein
VGAVVIHYELSCIGDDRQIHIACKSTTLLQRVIVIFHNLSKKQQLLLISTPTSSSTMDRDSLVYKAKLAEQAERFDEMVQDMYVEEANDSQPSE